MKKLLLLIPILYFSCKDDTPDEGNKVSKVSKPSEVTLLKSGFVNKVDSLIPTAKQFVESNRYNHQIVFIVDLSMHSGLERFAVVDLSSDSVIHKGLVAHGAGGKYWSRKAVFSNTPNSLCSSPGKYKIGAKYNGRFGKAYKLHGLDNTNSKAFERFIVLHGYDCVPDESLYPEYLCNSEGCPMVSYKFLDVLSSYIDKSNKPILLWIIG
jgi:hypothetical protein